MPYEFGGGGGDTVPNRRQMPESEAGSAGSSEGPQDLPLNPPHRPGDGWQPGGDGVNRSAQWYGWSHNSVNAVTTTELHPGRWRRSVSRPGDLPARNRRTTWLTATVRSGVQMAEQRGREEGQTVAGKLSGRQPAIARQPCVRERVGSQGEAQTWRPCVGGDCASRFRRGPGRPGVCPTSSRFPVCLGAKPHSTGSVPHSRPRSPHPRARRPRRQF